MFEKTGHNLYRYLPVDGLCINLIIDYRTHSRGDNCKVLYKSVVLFIQAHSSDVHATTLWSLRAVLVRRAETGRSALPRQSVKDTCSMDILLKRYAGIYVTNDAVPPSGNLPSAYSFSLSS